MAQLYPKVGYTGTVTAVRRRRGTGIGGFGDLKNPPRQLFYRGEWDEELWQRCAAVVGSRRMTEYGRRVIAKIVPQLVQDGWAIVSGFMYGVDQEAHRVCVECGGRTIAVLGWGINQALGDSDQKLLQRILANKGLVISEWEEQKPTLWTFPLRNRLVAAISAQIIVVEAAVKSGALITAQLGAKLGRQVWAVPGPVTSSVSAGTNRLIATGQAKMWLGENTPTLKPKSPILKLVENEGLDASEIARQLRQPVEEVGAQLSLLALAGEVVEREGKYYPGD